MRAEGVASSGGTGSGAMIGPVCRKLFRKMDRNHDGAVSFAEARQSGVFRVLEMAKTADEEKQAFGAADSNHDNSLSQGEAYAFFGKALAQSKRTLALAILFTATEPDEDEPVESAATRAKAKNLGKREENDDVDSARRAKKAEALSPAHLGQMAHYALQEASAESEEKFTAAKAALDARLADEYAAAAQRADAARASAALKLSVR